MKHLLILLFLLCFVSVSAQDVIVKQDGSTIVCRIVDLTSSEITYKKWNDLNGSNYVMNRTDASAINYENGKKVNLSEVDNLYKPGNQNDGVQNYNDRALLEIDANEHPKKKLHIVNKWNIKAGLSLDMFTGHDDLGMKAGYEAGFGVLFPFKKNNFVIGIDAYICSYNTQIKSISENFSSAAVGGSPYIGYNFQIGSISLLPYIGPSMDWVFYEDGSYKNNYPWIGLYGYDLIEDMGEIPYHLWSDGYNVGIIFGLKAFVSNNFFIDFHCRKNFNSFGLSCDNIVRAKPYELDSKGNKTYGKEIVGEATTNYYDVCPLKIVLGIGYQF